jgi:acetyl-CoA acetyltransferase
MSKIEKNRARIVAAGVLVGKAKRGRLASTRPDEMGAEVIRELLRRAPALDPADIEDVILGSSCPEGEQGMNMARLVALSADLPITVAGETLTRFCSSVCGRLPMLPLPSWPARCRWPFRGAESIYDTDDRL